jgi:hypothetical protein
MTVGETLGTVFPISVSFVQGEQPASGKFSGWANQTSAGLNLLARGIGDLWGSEFDENKLYVADHRPPHIINLARLIGPASAINPVRPVAPASRIEYDVILDPDDIPIGVNEFNLRDDCDVEPAINWDATHPSGLIKIHTSLVTVLEYISTTAADSVFTNRELTRAAVNAVGDYYVDTQGNVLTYSRTGDYNAISPSASTTYQTCMTPDMYDQATLNVIPDMNQETTDYLCQVLSLGGDEYIVRTPYLVKLPRRDVFDAPLEPGDSGCPPLSFATTERARLPYALKAADGMNLSDGDQIPDGFMGLWDTDNDRIITGLTFKLSDEGGYDSDYCVIVSGGTLEVTADRYRLITVGTTITETLAYNVRKWDIHDHSVRAGGFPISHINITSRHIDPSVVSAIWSTEVGSPHSAIAGNDHPQYLSRYGWTGTDGDEGQYDNAMLGDIFMARDTADYTALGYDTSGNSKKIYFSTDTTFMYKSSGSDLRLDGMNLHVGYGETDAALYFAGSAQTEALKYDTSESTFFFIDGAGGVSDSVLQAGKILIHSQIAHEDPTALTSGGPAIEIFVETSGDATAEINLEGETGASKGLVLTAKEAAINNTILSEKGLTITTGGSGTLELYSADAMVLNSADTIDLDASGAITLDASSGNITLLGGGDIKVAGHGSTTSYMLFASLDDNKPVLDIYSSLSTDSIQLGRDDTRYYFGMSGTTDELYFHNKFQGATSCKIDLTSANFFCLPSGSAGAIDGCIRWDSGNQRIEVFDDTGGGAGDWYYFTNDGSWAV